MFRTGWMLAQRLALRSKSSSGGGGGTAATIELHRDRRQQSPHHHQHHHRRRTLATAVSRERFDELMNDQQCDPSWYRKIIMASEAQAFHEGKNHFGCVLYEFDSMWNLMILSKSKHENEPADLAELLLNYRDKEQAIHILNWLLDLAEEKGY